MPENKKSWQRKLPAFAEIFLLFGVMGCAWIPHKLFVIIPLGATVLYIMTKTFREALVYFNKKNYIKVRGKVVSYEVKRIFLDVRKGLGDIKYKYQFGDVDYFGDKISPYVCSISAMEKKAIESYGAICMDCGDDIDVWVNGNDARQAYLDVSLIKSDILSSLAILIFGISLVLLIVLL